MLPVWQRVIEPLRTSGRIAVLGIVQEQHPDRSRLYAQWRQLPFPVAVDALNRLDYRGIPRLVGLDARGVVVADRMRRASQINDFANAADAGSAPATPTPEHFAPPTAPGESASAQAWRDAADAWFLAGRLSRAIAAYLKVVAQAPGDGRAWFRLGVALRRRADGSRAEAGDAQAAIDAWGFALARRPDQYIWRRRIQQYGPRMVKPYNFYGWVADARAAITARGETPVPLTAEPVAVELAAPRREASTPATLPAAVPADADLPLDTAAMIRIQPLVTPARVRPGHAVRVRLRLTVDPKTTPFWNNEGPGLRLRLTADPRWRLIEGRFDHPNARPAESREPRELELELLIAETAAPGPLVLTGHVAYDVCEDQAGVCRRLRQAVRVQLVVDPRAPTLK